MAEDKKGAHGEGCMCSSCGGCGCQHGKHWTFFLLRVLITIIILMMVFTFGAFIGKLTSNSSYARRTMMMRYGGTPGGMYGGGMGMPMMRANGATSTAPTGGTESY